MIQSRQINNYFTSVGDVAKKLPTTVQPMHSFINREPPALDTIDIDKECLRKKIYKIKPGKAAGPDNIKA